MLSASLTLISHYRTQQQVPHLYVTSVLWRSSSCRGTCWVDATLTPAAADLKLVNVSLVSKQKRSLVLATHENGSVLPITSFLMLRQRKHRRKHLEEEPLLVGYPSSQKTFGCAPWACFKTKHVKILVESKIGCLFFNMTVFRAFCKDDHYQGTICN